MSFSDRIRQHDTFSERVVSIIENAGFVVIPYGAEHILSSIHHAALVSIRDNAVSKFVRFLPDYIALRSGDAVFFDVKSPSSKWDTIAIELDAVAEYKALASFGLPVFLVMKELQTCWATDIVFKRVFNNALQFRSSGGSGTPFGVVNEHITPLQHLSDFLLARRQLSLL